MNNSVFFVVEKISPHWHGEWYFIIISFMVGIAFFLFTRSKKTKNIIANYSNNKYTKIPDIQDENFPEKIFLFLQNFVSEKYMPKNGFAHTYKDIAKYCNNKKILQFYKSLEENIFQNMPLGNTKKEEVLKELHEIIKTTP